MTFLTQSSKIKNLDKKEYPVKLNIFFALLLSTLLSINASFAADETTSSTTTTATAPSTKAPTLITKLLQFTLKAKSGAIKTVDSSQSLYQLDLQGVDGNVLYFTNRPRRIVDSMTTRFFLKRWLKPPPRDYSTVPPNAIIIYPDKRSGMLATSVVILMNPVYDATRQTLQFTIKPTAGNLNLPPVIKMPVITMAEITVCGVLGSWGNLPGETQYDVECHKQAQAQGG